MKFIKEHPIHETHAPLRPKQGDTYQKVEQAGDLPEDKNPSFGFNSRHKQGDHYQQLASDFDSVEQTTKPKVGGKTDARPSQGDKYQKLSEQDVIPIGDTNEGIFSGIKKALNYDTTYISIQDAFNNVTDAMTTKYKNLKTVDGGLTIGFKTIPVKLSDIKRSDKTIKLNGETVPMDDLVKAVDKLVKSSGVKK
jgi:hypothetical protein